MANTWAKLLGPSKPRSRQAIASRARSQGRSQLPLEVAMARKAVQTRQHGRIKKALSPKPSKHTAKGRMIHKSRHKKAWHKATGQGNYGGYDKWGKSQ